MTSFRNNCAVRYPSHSGLNFISSKAISRIATAAPQRELALLGLLLGWGENDLPVKGGDQRTWEMENVLHFGNPPGIHPL